MLQYKIYSSHEPRLQKSITSTKFYNNEKHYDAFFNLFTYAQLPTKVQIENARIKTEEKKHA